MVSLKLVIIETCGWCFSCLSLWAFSVCDRNIVLLYYLYIFYYQLAKSQFTFQCDIEIPHVWFLVYHWEPLFIIFSCPPQLWFTMEVDWLQWKVDYTRLVMIMIFYTNFSDCILSIFQQFNLYVLFTVEFKNL